MGHRLPFHKLLQLTSTESIVAAFGNQFVVIEASTGRIIAAPASKCADVAATGAQAIPDEAFPAGNIRALAFHAETQRLAIATESKELMCWDINKWTPLSKRETIKRANCVAFSKDGTKILIGDKFGDVYSSKADNETEREVLILGHVSMITDMAVSVDGNYVLTADRDEKIRVSRYPLAFDIVEFCLGHKQFVSSIHILPFAPNLLVSGGGDPFLLVWDFMTGSLLQNIPLQLHPDALSAVAVVSMKTHTPSRTLAVVIEGYKGILVFDASNSKHIKPLCTIALDVEALDVEFDATGNIWVAYGPQTEGSQIAVSTYLRNEKRFSSISSDTLARKANAMGTSSVATLPDFHSTGKLRKTTPAELKQNQLEKRRKNNEIGGSGSKQ